MNLERLRQMQTALQALAAELDAALVEAEVSRDPLVAHIFRARQQHRVTSGRDTSKDGHHVKRELNAGFRRAADLGYRGRPGESILTT
ncbi:MAG: hypothetical protein QOE70_4617 [Chthoniobacter sp.]|jgi:hypothetical protein|nr:hypothetical protein [Chthoniobacter sp.]